MPAIHALPSYISRPRIRGVTLKVVPNAQPRQQFDVVAMAGARVFKKVLQANPMAALGLSSGSTPLGLYRCLIERHNKTEIDFTKIRATYNLDEYVGVPPEFYEQTYRYFMETQLFDYLGLPHAIRNIPDWRTKDPVATCEEYEKAVVRAEIDLQVLGLGANTHIAFCEPGSLLTSVTHVVELALRSRISNSRLFMREEEGRFLGLEKNAREEFEDPWDKMTVCSSDQNYLFFQTILPRVPNQAMTMGISTIMRAKEILMLVTGQAKAEALNLMLTQHPSQDYPASWLRYHPRVTVIADQAAASLLINAEWRETGTHIIDGSFARAVL